MRMQLVSGRHDYHVTRNCNFSVQNGQSCPEICKSCKNFHLITINIHPSLHGHLNYFHIMVAKLCTTEHQSCQKPETLSVGHFFQEKLLDLGEMS